MSEASFSNRLYAQNSVKKTAASKKTGLRMLTRSERQERSKLMKTRPASASRPGSRKSTRRVSTTDENYSPKEENMSVESSTTAIQCPQDYLQQLEDEDGFLYLTSTEEGFYELKVLSTTPKTYPFWTVSRNGFTYNASETTVDFWTTKNFFKEQKLTKNLMRLKFFKLFVLRKNFQIWRKFIRNRKMTFAIKKFNTSIRSIPYLLQTLEQIKLLLHNNFYSLDWPNLKDYYFLNDFCGNLKDFQQIMQENFLNTFRDIKELVLTACQIHFKTEMAKNMTQTATVNTVNKRSLDLNDEDDNRPRHLSYQELAKQKSISKNLMGFLVLIDLMVFEFLRCKILDMTRFLLAFIMGISCNERCNIIDESQADEHLAPMYHGDYQLFMPFKSRTDLIVDESEDVKAGIGLSLQLTVESLSVNPSMRDFVESLGSILSDFRKLASCYTRLVLDPDFGSIIEKAGVTTGAFENTLSVINGMIREDQWYRNVVSQIKTIVRDNYVLVKQYLAKYNSYQTILANNKDWVIREDESVDWYRSCIEKFTEDRKMIEEVPAFKIVGELFKLDFEYMVATLRPIIERNLDSIYALLPKILKAKSEALIDTYKGYNKQLLNDINTVEQFYNARQLLDYLEESESKNLEKEERYVRNIHEVLEDYGPEYLGDLESAIFKNLNFESENFIRSSEKLENYLEDRFTFFQKKHFNNVKVFKESLSALIEEIQDSAFYQWDSSINLGLPDPTATPQDITRMNTTSDNVRRLISRTSSLKKDITKHLSTRDQFIDYSKILDPSERINLDDILALSKEITAKNLLWESIEDFRVYLINMCCVPFTKINLKELKDEIAKYEDIYTQIITTIGENNVITEFKKQVELGGVAPHLVEIFTSPSLQDRHFITIEKLLTNTKLPPDNQLTLSWCLTNGVNHLLEKLKAINDQAIIESDLEKELENIEVQWTEINVSMVNDSDKDLYIVGDITRVLETIDNHLAILQRLKQNPFVAAIEQRLGEWIQRINQIATSLDIFLQVQKDWLYFFAVFNETDVPKLLSDVAPVYNFVDRGMKELCENLRVNPNVLASFSRPNSLENLRKFKDKLAVIRDRLNNFIKRRKHNFKRLLLLPDSHILDLFVSTGKKAFVTETAPLMTTGPTASAAARPFSGLQYAQVKLGSASHKIPKYVDRDYPTFKSIFNFDQLRISVANEEEKIIGGEIIGVQDKYTSLQLEGFKPRGTLDTWLDALQDQISFALKKNVIVGLQKYFTMDLPTRVTKMLPQVHMLVEELHFSKRIEDIINGSDMLRELPALHTMLQTRIRDLSDYFAKSLTKEKFYRFSNCLVLLQRHVQVVEGLIRAKDIADTRWKESLHFITNVDLNIDETANINDMAESLRIQLVYKNRAFDYSFEFMGLELNPVFSPEAVQALKDLLENPSNLVLLKSNEHGTGKLSVIQMLSIMLGRFSVFVDGQPDESVDPSHIFDILRCGVECGIICGIKDANRFSSEFFTRVFDFVKSSISTINNAQSRYFVSSEFSDEFNRVDVFDSSFICMTSCNLSQEHISIESEDCPYTTVIDYYLDSVEYITSIWLEIMGFQRISELAENIATLSMYATNVLGSVNDFTREIDVFEHSLPEKKFFFGLPVILRWVKHASILHTIEPDASEDQIIVKAIISLESPKFSNEQESEEFYDLVEKIFSAKDEEFIDEAGIYTNRPPLPSSQRMERTTSQGILGKEVDEEESLVGIVIDDISAAQESSIEQVRLLIETQSGCLPIPEQIQKVVELTLILDSTDSVLLIGDQDSGKTTVLHLTADHYMTLHPDRSVKVVTMTPSAQPDELDMIVELLRNPKTTHEDGLVIDNESEVWLHLNGVPNFSSSLLHLLKGFPNVKLILEVDSLQMVDPKVISKCQVIAISNCITWMHVLQTRVARLISSGYPEIVCTALIDNLEPAVPKVLQFLENYDLVLGRQKIMIDSTFYMFEVLFEVIISQTIAMSKKKEQTVLEYLEHQADTRPKDLKQLVMKVLSFAITWCFAGQLSVDERHKFDTFLRKELSYLNFALGITCFDWYFDVESQTALEWRLDPVILTMPHNGKTFIIHDEARKFLYISLLFAFTGQNILVYNDRFSGVSSIIEVLQYLLAHPIEISKYIPAPLPDFGSLNFSTQYYAADNHTTFDNMLARIEKDYDFRVKVLKPLQEDTVGFCVIENLESWVDTQSIDYVGSVVSNNQYYKQSKLIDVEMFQFFMSCSNTIDMHQLPWSLKKANTILQFNEYSTSSLTEMFNSYCLRRLEDIEMTREIETVLKESVVETLLSLFTVIPEELPIDHYYINYVFNSNGISEVLDFFCRKMRKAATIDPNNLIDFIRPVFEWSINTYLDRLSLLIDSNDTEMRQLLKTKLDEEMSARFNLSPSDVDVNDQFISPHLFEFETWEERPEQFDLYEDLKPRIARLADVMTQKGGNVHCSLIGPRAVGKKTTLKYVCHKSNIAYFDLSSERNATTIIQEAVVHVTNTMENSVLVIDNALLDDEILTLVLNVIRGHAKRVVNQLWRTPEEIAGLFSNLQSVAKKKNRSDTDSALWGQLLSQITQSLHICLLFTPQDFFNRIDVCPDLCSKTVSIVVAKWPEYVFRNKAQDVIKEIGLDSDVDLIEIFKRTELEPESNPVVFLNWLNSYKELYLSRSSDIASNIEARIKAVESVKTISSIIVSYQEQLKNTETSISDMASKSDSLIMELARKQKQLDMLKNGLEDVNDRIKTVLEKMNQKQAEIAAELSDHTDALKALQQQIAGGNFFSQFVEEFSSDTFNQVQKVVLNCFSTLPPDLTVQRIKDDWPTFIVLFDDFDSAFWSESVSRFKSHDTESLRANHPFSSIVLMWMKHITNYWNGRESLKDERAMVDDQKKMLEGLKTDLTTKLDEKDVQTDDLNVVKTQFEQISNEKATLATDRSKWSAYVDLGEQLISKTAASLNVWSDEAERLKEEYAELYKHIYGIPSSDVNSGFIKFKLPSTPLITQINSVNVNELNDGDILRLNAVDKQTSIIVLLEDSHAKLVKEEVENVSEHGEGEIEGVEDVDIINGVPLSFFLMARRVFWKRIFENGNYISFTTENDPNHIIFTAENAQIKGILLSASYGASTQIVCQLINEAIDECTEIPVRLNGDERILAHLSCIVEGDHRGICLRYTPPRSLTRMGSQASVASLASLNRSVTPDRASSHSKL
ncbi:hypothetical protein PCE1_001891 [Barthelona sp. PCE]